MSAGSDVRRVQLRGMLALAEREVLRVLRLWTQTVAPQVISATLFIVVFGIALGTQIRTIDGIPYERFIVPGLLLMGVVTSAFANTATSIFQARNDGFIEDPASSPMAAWQMLAAYLSGGVLRAALIGAATLATARVFVSFPLSRPDVLLAALLLAALSAAALGIVVGLHSRSWELQTVTGNLVIQPLVFLGGVFYSARALTEPWETLTRVDPLLYAVSATRHGVLGEAEVAIPLSIGVSVALAAAMVGWAYSALARGVGIRT